MLFLLVCSISALLGLFVIVKNPTKKLNRVFFAVCICLCIWSFGFSIAIIAPDASTCLFWRRFSAIGWGAIYCSLLQFVLVISEKDIKMKKWFYPIFYLPAAVCIYVFGFSSKMANIQYHFIKTNHGWANIAFTNGWDVFFYCYFVTYSLIGLAFLWQWKKQAKKPYIIKQARIIFTTFVSILVCGSFTDVINSQMMYIHIPQLGPILFILLLATISYCIRKYRLMNNNRVDEDELILNLSNRSKVYHISSLVLVACGMIYVICQYSISHNESLLSSLSTGGFLALLGIVISISYRCTTNNVNMEVIYSLVSMLVTPLFIVKLIGYTDTVIWAFPFITIIISLIFNRSILLKATILSMYLTQIYLWFAAPGLHITIQNDVFVGRITILTVGVIFALYVHKIYILRLSENADQVHVQKIASEISTNFVTVNSLNIVDKIHSLLETVGLFFEIEHVSLKISKEDYISSKLMQNLHWNSKGADQRVDLSLELGRYFGETSIIQIPDLRKIPSDAHLIRKTLEERNSFTLLSVPIFIQDEAIGRLTLESEKPEKCWTPSRMSLLEILSNVIANALVKANAEEKIHFMAYYDSLTKLPNRLLFNQRTEVAMKNVKQKNHRLAIVFLDLDLFKDVNDSIGHEAGDLLIQKVTEQLTDCVRPSDTVSRFGGDEFLIMLNDLSDPTEATTIAKKMLDLFHGSFMLHEQEVFITASIGLALFPEDGQNTETLIKNADTAMYAAKNKGKNQYTLFSNEMKEKQQFKMILTSSLFHAQERNEFMILYQPQVGAKSERIIGLEALLRWKHTEYGMISPNEFIPLAEQTGLINEIGEWVLRTACMQLKAWIDQGLPPVRMAVNLSVVQLRNPLLVQQVKQVLLETGLDPALLELEITESATVKDFEFIVRVLNQLKAIGVSLSIDDFGTKYSSLGRLKDLPVDRLKMDMQFVQDIDHSEKGAGIAKAIINLAKYLDMRMIAEGVENQTELEFLRKWDCDEIQGYYFYRPLDAEVVRKILQQSVSNS
nr:EAL domain-containing protein [Sporolactobacillus kofuensis]